MQVRARAEQQGTAWRQRYPVRSGIEGPVCEFARGHGMMQCRYCGQHKAHVQITNRVKLRRDSPTRWHTEP
ncbi:hypothetical protein [Nocardia sp. NBC_01730]|uniref:hypothetical protein n=1 Tax=Nocardia sp. NBC_01730 TaxID=2975998 RepID=UPI003FA39BE6